MARGPLRRQEEIALDTIRIRNQEYQRTHGHDPGYRPGEEPTPTYRQVADEFAAKKLAIVDPTTLILIDEADRLRMPTLEQARALFDQGEQQGGFGLILIGMPGIEKRMAAIRSFIPGSALCMHSGRSAPPRCVGSSTGAGRLAALKFRH